MNYKLEVKRGDEDWFVYYKSLTLEDALEELLYLKGHNDYDEMRITWVRPND